MAKSSADDQELRRACEAAIEGKEKVVMSIRVAKSRGIWGKSGKAGRNMAKPRVLALTSKSNFLKLWTDFLIGELAAIW